MPLRFNKKTVAILIASFVSAPTSICTALLASIYGWFSNVDEGLLLLCYTLPTLLGGLIPMFVTPFLSKVEKKYFVSGGLVSIFAGGIIILLLGLKAFPIALIGLCLVGLGQTIVQAGTNLMLSEDFPETANAACSFNFAIYNIGQIVCGALAGILATGKWNNAYLVCLPAIIGAFLMIILTGSKAASASAAKCEITDSAPKASPAGPINYGQFAILLIIVLLIMVSNAGWYTNYSVYIIDEAKIGTTVQTGLILSIGNLGGMVGGFLFSPIFSKIFKRWSIPLFILLICAPNLAAFLGCKSMLVFYITMFMLLGFFVPLNGEIMAASYKIAPNLVSFITGWFAVVGFAAPYVLNFFANAFGGDISVKFATSLICALIAIVLSVFFVRSMNKAEATAANV